ncbi:MAG: hypothetical protein M0R46_02605 [Candidatus Muirbacterium halophilum]|nr:hypothetical protein [Candidatus Muirbacterium halophilum]MCK9474781.1 hypothetical protein [Candidatus Muirbacterium halophilum]
MIITYALTKKRADLFRGYFLSVNEEGIPVDYKFTEDLRLSKFQKYIFGSTLDRYIKTKVFFEKFLKTIDYKIDFVVFEDEVFLENKVFENCAFVQDTDETPLSETGEFELQNDGSYLLQYSFSGSPVKVRVKEEKIIKRLSDIIKEIASQTYTHNFTILEPLERLRRVSEEL